MKRIIVLFLLLALLLAGCGREKPEPGQLVFYYKSAYVAYNQPSSVLGSEYRDVKVNNGDVITILNIYLDGPKTTDLVNVFPLDCEVVEFIQNGKVATVRFNSTILQLEGISQTMAFVCMSKTIMELTDAERVRIGVANASLAGKEYVEFTQDNVMYFDDSKTLGDKK